MTQKQIALPELIQAVLNECEILKYEKNTLENFKDTWYAFKRYSECRNEFYYKEQVAAQFLKELYDYPEVMPESRIACAMIRAMRVLGDYHLFGRLLSHKGKLRPPASIDFKLAVVNFIDYCKKRNNSEATIQRRLWVVHKFIEHLMDSGVNVCADITSQHISSYVTCLVGYAKRTAERDLECLRVLFRSMYFSGQRMDDLSGAVPKLYFPTQDRIPTVWTVDEVKRLLGVIDRGSPTGKRDYAIILLVAQLGLRTTDVQNLKLENINWEESRVEFIQQKTSVTVSLPMMEDLGLAIIDYLQYGRPKTDAPYVFVKHLSPYEKMENGYHILTQYLIKAGIKLEKSKPHGLHSLRHTLASRLLEQDVPLEVISSILGHSTVESTKPYLHIDIDHLRRCALSSREVSEHERTY